MDYIKRKDFEDIQKYNILELGIKKEVFVEKAALKVIKNIDLLHRETFAIVCGITENGAYGLSIARNLIALNKYVEIYIVDNTKEASDDFKIQFDIIKKMNIEVNYLETIEELELFSSKLEKVNTIIDAITGIEFDNIFRGPTEYIIDTINKSRIYTISVDLPSGMDYDTGKVHVAYVDCDLVVTFEKTKLGLENVSNIHKFEVKVEKLGFVKRGKDVRYKTY